MSCSYGKIQLQIMYSIQWYALIFIFDVHQISCKGVNLFTGHPVCYLLHVRYYHICLPPPQMFWPFPLAYISPTNIVYIVQNYEILNTKIIYVTWIWKIVMCMKKLVKPSNCQFYNREETLNILYVYIYKF